MPKSLLPLALALLLTGAVHAASRYAGEFLGLGAGARSVALGSAYVALADDATAGYWNAAGLSALSGRQVHLTHSEHFSGLIQRDFVAIARPGRLLHGMALSLVRMGIDDIHFTELPDPLQPPALTTVRSSPRPNKARITPCICRVVAGSVRAYPSG